LAAVLGEGLALLELCDCLEAVARQELDSRLEGRAAEAVGGGAQVILPAGGRGDDTGPAVLVYDHSVYCVVGEAQSYHGGGPI
jgi:hypothetical protein